MDEYDFLSYEPPKKQLNIKKVVIISIIVIATIIVIIAIFSYSPKERTETPPMQEVVVEVPDPNLLYFDISRSISIELSTNYNLQPYNSEGKYLIELRSDENVHIFISKKDILPNKKLNPVVTADRLVFVESFNNISNLSEVKDVLVNGVPACTYSFHYLSNLNKIFYIQVTWLELNNCYYVFDIEFPLNDLITNSNLVTETLITFKEHINQE